MRRQFAILGAGVFVFLCHEEQAEGFVLVVSKPGVISSSHGYHCKTTKCWNSKSKLFGPGDDDDDDQDVGSGEGQALAQKFYQQLRQRENLPSSNNDLSTSNSIASGGDKNDEQIQQLNKKKFTGKAESEPASFSTVGNDIQGSLFNSGGGTTNRQRRSPREQMMEREFQLVGRAEKGLAYQAVLAFAVLCFYIYVGLTGGITSGEEFTALDFDYGADTTLIEDTVPQPRDTEPSYWL